MKNILLICILSLFAFSPSTSNKPVDKTNKYFTLSGKISGYTEGVVTAFFWSKKTYSTDTIKPMPNGDFRKQILLKESPCDLLVKYTKNKRNYYYIYAQNGYSTILNIDASDAIQKVTFAGDGKEVNDFNQTYYKFFQTQFISTKTMNEIKSMNFKTYSAKVDSEKVLCRTLLSKIKDNNIRMTKGIALDCNSTIIKLRYLEAHNGESPVADKDFVAYARSINLNDYNYAKQQVTEQVLNWYLAQQNCSFHDFDSYFDMIQKKITNQKAINSISTDYMEFYLKNPDNKIDSHFTRYSKLCNDKSAISRLRKIYQNIVLTKQGAAESDFTMYDINGKSFKLSDFKGKAVYVDVWSTWCMPCKHEIPYLSKLAEKYKNDNRIEIISISIDEDKQAWKDMITKDNPQWKQFIVDKDWKSDLCKDYVIQAIPRFIFIDKNGVIISANALRPSSTDIESYINKNIH